MIRKLFLALSVSLFASTSAADLITIGTDAPPGSPVEMSPGSISSPILITITNNIPIDAPADLFEGWQTNLRVVPDLGATGTLTFNSPTTGIAPAPVNYVFASTTSFGINANNMGDTLIAFDLEFPTGPGVQVPLPPGFNLLQVDFAASPDALGTFSLFALGGPGQSEWTAADLTARDFVNVPNVQGSMVLIGQVVVVPEPALAFFAACAVGGVLMWRRRRNLSPEGRPQIAGGVSHR